MNRQVYVKAEQIARLIVKGCKATQIAVEMGMSYPGLMRILHCPEYLKIEESVRAEQVGRLDARLIQRAALNDDVDDAVPEALGILLEEVKVKRNLRAALEVLDRDPRRQFAKGKAVEVTAPGAQAAGATTLTGDALGTAIKDAESTHDILVRVPQPTSKTAEA